MSLHFLINLCFPLSTHTHTHTQVELEKATTVQQEPSEEPSIEMREPSFSQIIYNENLKRVAQNARMHTPLKAVVTDEVSESGKD